MRAEATIHGTVSDRSLESIFYKMSCVLCFPLHLKKKRVTAQSPQNHIWMERGLPQRVFNNSCPPVKIKRLNCFQMVVHTWGCVHRFLFRQICSASEAEHTPGISVFRQVLSEMVWMCVTHAALCGCVCVYFFSSFFFCLKLDNDAPARESSGVLLTTVWSHFPGESDSAMHKTLPNAFKIIIMKILIY